jgi:hypothetical protein
MAKRSPNHPSVSLPEALERARDFFYAWGEKDASFEESLKQWGYTSRSYVGRKLVASMISFGLLEKTGPNRSAQSLRINGSIQASLFDTHAASDNYSDTILQMALKPDIFRRVWERWGLNLPDGERFQRYLVEELGFNPRAINRFVRCYVDTIELARQHGLGPERHDNIMQLEFEDYELHAGESHVPGSDDKDDTDLNAEEVEEPQCAQPQMYLVINEDTDFEFEMEEDEELLPPPREPVDDDDINFDFSSAEDGELKVDHFSRLSKALQLRALASGGKMRELGRYSLRDGCEVAIYADGAIDRETLEELFTHMIADLVLGAFDTEDNNS